MGIGALTIGVMKGASCADAIICGAYPGNPMGDVVCHWVAARRPYCEAAAIGDAPAIILLTRAAVMSGMYAPDVIPTGAMGVTAEISLSDRVSIVGHRHFFQPPEHFKVAPGCA